MVKIKEVQNILNKLKSKRFNYICRCMDIVDIGFGETNEWKSCRGYACEKPEFAFHLQCSFKIENAEGILFESKELNCIQSGENAHFTKRDMCVLDEKSKQVMELLKNEIVESAEVGINGDIEIKLTNSVISIYNDGNEQSEVWRFIEFSEGAKHIVKRYYGFYAE